MKYVLYYHIFVTDHPQAFEIINEQIDTIKNSVLHHQYLDSIQCCISGNVMENYCKVNEIISLEKFIFGDHPKFLSLESSKAYLTS
mgnify:CR=1 FL=1